MSNQRASKSPTMNTSFDDWETDPDFVREMDEIDQRWGSKRTVGSINMNELIDEVRRDHKTLRDKFRHSSQDQPSDFDAKLTPQLSGRNFDFTEQKRISSQEISRQVISTTKSSSQIIKQENNGHSISDAKRTFMEKSENTHSTSKNPTLAPKPNIDEETFARLRSNAQSTQPKSWQASRDSSPREFEESKRVFREEKTSSSSSSAIGAARPLPQAFASIQDKIDAFKKEFENIENKVAKKSDLSKVIKKTTNIEKTSDTGVKYVSRNEGPSRFSPQSAAPSSLSHEREAPKASIKSLSNKFETLLQDSGEDFKRQTEAKRKEYFDQIKSQVRETRKGLGGFDPIDDDGDDKVSQTHQAKHYLPPSAGKQYTCRFSSSPSSRPSSRLSNDSMGSNKPKVYTRREIEQESIVSRIVKENDKVVENQTKRNVEKSSSVHGSSDEDEPSSIKFIDQKLRASPHQRVQSPVDEIRRSIPELRPETKGAGLMARTLYDYEAAEQDELSFDIDDLITNIEKVDAGWYRGTITKGGRRIEGLFPANYVKLLNDSGEY